MWGLENGKTPERTDLARSHRSTNEHGTEQLPAVLQGFSIKTCTFCFKSAGGRLVLRFWARTTGA